MANSKKRKSLHLDREMILHKKNLQKRRKNIWDDQVFRFKWLIVKRKNFQEQKFSH